MPLYGLRRLGFTRRKVFSIIKRYLLLFTTDYNTKKNFSDFCHEGVTLRVLIVIHIGNYLLRGTKKRTKPGEKSEIFLSVPALIHLNPKSGSHER